MRELRFNVGKKHCPEYSANVFSVPGLIIFTTTEPSMIMASTASGILVCGVVEDWRHSASSDFF